MLTQKINLSDLVAHIAGEKPITLDGHRIASVNFEIERRSDGFDDRDSQPGGVPFVAGAIFTWIKK